MANLNRIILVGRLAADPEGRTTMNGLPMTKFRLAVSQGQQSGTDFFDIVTWQRLAENCAELFKKDQLVLVEGRIQIRSFEDQTGQRRWVTEIVARDMRMLEKSHAGEQKMQETKPQTSEEIPDESELASDLPF